MPNENKSSLIKSPLEAFKMALIFIFIAKANADRRLDGAATSSVMNMLTPNLETHHIERINGSINYRLYGGKKAKEDKHWLDGRGLGMQHVKCVRHGSCEKLSFSTCLGAKIPYEYTSLDLTTFDDQKDVEEHLRKFEALKHVPKCWAVIQPFLCAVFVPKCEQINGEDMVYLPSLEMCRITLEPCRILYNTPYFPEFLRCNETHFPSKCINDVREIKFNLTGECLDPLVTAESSASYYPLIEGCGVRCNDPLYTEDEHRQIHKLISWVATLCFLANLFVVTTFFIEWGNASKYPAQIVFYINLCFMIVCCGWLAQFYPGSREDIVCRKDGTLRHSEPTAGQNLSCVIIFVVIYYSLIAAMVWFVFLTYAWHLRAVGNFQERIDKKGSCFHLVAWSLPLVLTITTLALSEVDGNSTVGICFVGYHNHATRAGLLLGPLVAVILVGSYFIIRGMIMLSALKQFANGINSTLASNKIHDIIVRMGLCATFTLIFIFVAVACHAYEFRYSQEWSESLNEYIICRIFSPFSEHIQCKIEKRPSFSVLQLNLLCLFGSGITMSIWCWRSSSLDTWKHWIRKKCGKTVQGEVKMPKHKVIAQTWAKRKELEDKGRLSITLCNTYTDPVGLNFDAYDIKSSETVEISSTWANYLPKCVKRRMALTLANNSSSQGPRKSSLDSEISFSVRHVSVESRRNSVDSQVSVKIAEMKTKVAARTSTRQSGHHHHSKRSSNISKRNQKRKDFVATSERKTRGRRESSTSVESQVIALKKTIYPSTSQKVGVFTKSSTKRHGRGNSKRRPGNTNTTDIDEFLTQNSQWILPLLQKRTLESSSDGESSHSAFKMQDSCFDVMLKHETETDANRSNEALQIEEIYEAEANNLHKKPTTVGESIELQKSDEHSNQRISRNSVRSKQSRKSPSNAACSYTKKRNLRRQRHVSKYKTLLKVNDDKALLKMSDLNLNLPRHLSYGANGDSINMSQSYSELNLPLDVMLNSSYSNLSTDKPNSRTSKLSCDVGIQTNTYGIRNISDNDDDEDKENYDKERKNHIKFEKEKNNEKHTLLKHKPKETIVILSESEKLKMLLLPSK
uniref:Protein smoothened n=1 Tax=Glossina palpalis gambiensis TaxID=67801 RepID=A0A1B0AUL6_9MUSC